MTPQLWVDAVSVTFDGFRALDDLSLRIEAGELRCILGPNGAGKTTLLDVVTGKTRPDRGRVSFDGHDITRLPEHAIVRRGVGRKLQRPTVFPMHTVHENLTLASLVHGRSFARMFHEPDAATSATVDEILELTGLGPVAHAVAGSLSHGQKQWLEIGMLLVQRPKLLLVDEPVAGLTPNEVEKTARILTALAGAHTVVVVEHDMDFVRSIARTVTVLHEGRVLAEGPIRDVQADPRVVEVYLGG